MTRERKLDLGNFVEQYTACIAFLLVQQRALYTSCNGTSKLRPKASKQIAKWRFSNPQNAVAFC